MSIHDKQRTENNTDRTVMQIHEGWLTGVRRIESPNCDERPAGEVSLIVIHCISLPAGHFGNVHVEQFFTNCLNCDAHPDFDDIRELNVSSHLFIRRDGSIVQFVPLDQRAWHAGESSFDGRAQCNDFSIGVELEGVDTGCFTEQQYSRLVDVSKVLMAHWDIPVHRLVGHSDIAPGRKTDPGSGFDWARLRQEVST
jgi:AmpD protein